MAERSEIEEKHQQAAVADLVACRLAPRRRSGLSTATTIGLVSVSGAVSTASISS